MASNETWAMCSGKRGSRGYGIMERDGMGKIFLLSFGVGERALAARLQVVGAGELGATLIGVLCM